MALNPIAFTEPWRGRCRPRVARTVCPAVKSPGTSKFRGTLASHEN